MKKLLLAVLAISAVLSTTDTFAADMGSGGGGGTGKRLGDGSAPQAKHARSDFNVSPSGAGVVPAAGIESFAIVVYESPAAAMRSMIAAMSRLNAAIDRLNAATARFTVAAGVHEIPHLLAEFDRLFAECDRLHAEFNRLMYVPSTRLLHPEIDLLRAMYYQVCRLIDAFRLTVSAAADKLGK